jgi:epoxyqueuosine reductase
VKQHISIRNRLENIAQNISANLLGVGPATELSEIDRLTSWLKENNQGNMTWLKREPKARCNPQSLLPEAKSVISLAFVYGKAGLNGSDKALPFNQALARFARGKEYHKFVRKKLREFCKLLSKDYPQTKFKTCVDTSPILEKALAARSGLGWIGKNTLLINEKYGSYFVLGEIITDLELDIDTAEHIKNGCGSCRKCIEACPTGALTEPYILDAKRCLSYLTIESKDPLPSEFANLIKTGQYGCDICQEVCPYNEKRVY